MSLWKDEALQKIFLSNTPLVDVRAPVEFKENTIPGSVNLPILNDEERERVGTAYKNEGPQAALLLAHELVQGQVKSHRVNAWRDYFIRHPEARLFCFRGGLRSQTASQWLMEVGIETEPIEGGQKRIRQFLLELLTEAPMPKMLRIAGITGSGKTELLKSFQDMALVCDLEEHAHHRGSAYGHLGPQPTQATFENLVAKDVLRGLSLQTMLVEDEGKMIGRLIIPKRFFAATKKSPMVLIEEPLEARVLRIYNDYVKPTPPETWESRHSFFHYHTLRIAKKLGGLKSAVVMQVMEAAFKSQDRESLSRHAPWIEKLLVDYYDPMYWWALKKDQAPIQFRGTWQECQDYIKSSI